MRLHMLLISLSQYWAATLPTALALSWREPEQLVNNFQIPPGDSKVIDRIKSFVFGSKHESPDLSSRPDFCHDLDCPSFTVVNKTKDYELRSYVASRWVSTTLTGVDYDAASHTMFKKLFDYIQGKNDKKEKIDMTAPVTVRVIPGPGPSCDNNFTMSFFMSPKVEDPPTPSDKTVFLSKQPNQKIYVRSFSGYASKSTWLKNAEILANALLKDSQTFVQDHYFTAGYDSPFKIIGRHNEIWFIAQ